MKSLPRTNADSRGFGNKRPLRRRKNQVLWQIVAGKSSAGLAADLCWLTQIRKGKTYHRKSARVSARPLGRCVILSGPFPPGTCSSSSLW